MYENKWVDYGIGQGLRITKSGKAIWCKMEDGETVLIPFSQMSERSEVDDTGDIGRIIVSKYWADLPKIPIPPGAKPVNPDHRLVLISDQTKEEIRLHKVKCVWCGLKNYAQAQRCYHCLRDFRTGELTGEGPISAEPPYIEPPKEEKQRRREKRLVLVLDEPPQSEAKKSE